VELCKNEPASRTEVVEVPTLSGNFSLSYSTPDTPEIGESSEILLTYSGPAGANVILEEIAPGFDNYQWVQSAPQSADSSHPFSVPDVLAGDTYTFRLRADLNGHVVYSTPQPVTTPSAPGGPGVPAPTIVSVTNDTADVNQGYLDVVVADSDPNVTEISAGVNPTNPYVNPSGYGLNGGSATSAGSDGYYHLLVRDIIAQGPGTLSVAAYDSASTDFSAVATQAVTMPSTTNDFPYNSPTLSVTPTNDGTGDLNLSWTGAMTAAEDPTGGLRWGTTAIIFANPDGHSGQAGYGFHIVSKAVNPDGTGSEVIDPAQPFAGAVGDYAYVECASEDISNLVRISPYASPPQTNPQNLTPTPCNDSTGGGFRLVWDDNSNNETGFTIQRSTSADFSTDLQTFTVGANVTSYTDALSTASNSVQAGVVYYYQVAATNSVGASSFDRSGAVSLTLPTVSVSAIDPNATANGPDGNPQDAWFEITRNSDFTETLDVNFALSGTEPTGDYTITDVAGNAVGSSVEFQPGDHCELFCVAPKDETTDAASDDTVVADVAPGGSNAAYAAPSPTASVNIQQVAVPTASVYELTFGAFNTKDFHLVERDADGTSYSSPEWLAGSSPTSSPTQDYPICYTRSGVNTNVVDMTIDAQLHVTGLSGGHYEIEAHFTSPSDITVSTKASLSNGVLSGEVNVPGESNIGVYNTTVVWYISEDGGKTWIKAAGSGSTTNKTYVTGGNPAGSQLLDTVLNTGCRAAAGQTTYNGIVNSIWDTFHTRRILEADGNSLMHFWGATSTNNNNAASDFTTAGLVSQADGHCQAWASFLVDVWGAQGILASAWSIRPNDAYSARYEALLRSKVEGFTVKTGVSQGGTTIAGTGGAGGYFDGHAVVRLGKGGSGGTYIYDPSYGEGYATEQTWRDASEDQIYYLLADGVTQYPIDHKKRLHDTDFSEGVPD
jgi:hypothetical protein